MKNRIWLITLLALAAACSAPKEEASTIVEKVAKPYPTFSSDSAYAFVQKQVDFGPRVPETPGHAATQTWLIEKLKGYGFTVETQDFEANTYDGLTWNLSNIIAAYHPEAKKRILLAAHYDTRRIADKDTERLDEPIDGANDGASGVAVLLEIARVIGTQELKPEVGIDIILFDGEDDGEPEHAKVKDNSKVWWCLGSQHWSQNKHRANYSAYYGILVDLVGAKGARFYREGYSRKYASGILKKVWDNAHQVGQGDFFIYKDSPEILDDHAFVNQYARIPMIDIIEYSPDFGFGQYHHKHADNMDIIDQRTLQAVGETVLFTIYQE
ncbi:M28 family peptidase [Algoriphagus halophytocola]|uniref:M28 family peptidase n=1 Tax=Algoriphagus halophytocola TaxID=2991499 RepID=A0ABY6MJS7_9BACT|nr:MULTISPECIES: M28 family peptidase [unclassified Algoriphagus]UZD22672.1 M28 family peptidase [Algoriphagus sp. TR-M5]WBL43937.1 M28 family peptidase [Algoriphagus sp. TR-M9]